MMLNSLVKKLSVLTVCLIVSGVTLASNQFFEVGKSYLFIPRIGVIEKGTVTQVTDQEVVFNNRSILILPTKMPASIKNDDAKVAAFNGKAMMAYINSDKKESLLEPMPLKDIPTSFSRSEMTAVKLD